MANHSELSDFAVRELTSLFYCGNLHRSKSLRPENPLKKDLKLIAEVSNLIFRDPKFYNFKYKKGLKWCCRHGGLWVFDSALPIRRSNADVTYALVKEKLRSFMASSAFLELTWEDPVCYNYKDVRTMSLVLLLVLLLLLLLVLQLPVVPSLLDRDEQDRLKHDSGVLVLLFNCAKLFQSDKFHFRNFLKWSTQYHLDYGPGSVCELSSLIFRRPLWKRRSEPSYTPSTCFEFGQLLLFRSQEGIPMNRRPTLTYDFIYQRLSIWLFKMVDMMSNPSQELPVLEPKPADDGSEVTDFQLNLATDGLQVAHYRRRKLDRGGRVFRMGSDISHSGADISPIRTSPLLESILSPITIVTQREMLDFYCNHILYGKHGEEVQLAYIEDLHILLQSDSRLGEFVPEEVVTYLMGSLVYENILDYTKRIDIDAQTHIISILCDAVCSSEIGEEMRKNIIDNLMWLIESDSMYVQAELLFGLARLSKFDEYRRHFLQLGALEKLVKVARRANNVTLPECALLFSVICFTERNLPVDKGDAAIQIALSIIIKHRGCDHEVTAQAFSALAYLSEGTYVAIEGASSKRLMLYISDDEDLVAVSALEVVGNIVRWGKVRQITMMIKNGILKHLQRLLSHKFKMVRKEACWIISNITVGRKMYLKDLCEANLPNSLCNLLEADDLDLRMEAVWAIFNSIIYDDHDEQIDYPNRNNTCPYILGQTRKIAPEPSVRVFVHRWSDYVPYVKRKSSSWSLC